jgi:prepilin-type N-terminal cleavage/methylation domain-containing protein
MDDSRSFWRGWVRSKKTYLWKREPSDLLSYSGLRRGNKGFTLLELLVSIAIIVVLASLLSSLSGAKGKSLQTVCLNDLHQVGVGMSIYAENNQDYVISARHNTRDNPDVSFVRVCLDQQTAKGAITLGLQLSSVNCMNIWLRRGRPSLPICRIYTATQG